MVRTLTSHQCGLGFWRGAMHLWVQFVVGSRFALRDFLWVLRFSSLQKSQHSKFQFNQNRANACKPGKADAASSLSIVIFLNLRGTTQLKSEDNIH